MEGLLLATRLCVPPQLRRMVRRTRLSDALEQNIPQYKLILLAAPAGYGKTSLLAQWAPASHHPVAWLSLSAEDNDVERFLRYLLASWENVQAGVRETQLGLHLGAVSPDTGAVLSAFINVAGDVTRDTVFILDDYHLIEDQAIHQALTFLLDHLPPKLHIVLSARGEPPLPLARYRARRELLEFHAEDLSFLQNETRDFLTKIMNLDLTEEQVVTLQTRLEGWIAGLQLVALTLRQRPEGASTPLISGRHRFIADYLTEEVLAYLPDETRHFLLRTSILDRLSGPLCDVVTRGEASQQTLEMLERENLFLVPLDDHRQWFRYHRLFGDFLQSELERRHPDELVGLHRLAARWHLEHELPEPAFHHGIAAADADLVIQIFENYFEPKLLCGEFTLLKRWLNSLPDRWYSDYPYFNLIRAGVFLFTGALDAAVHCVDEVEEALEPAEGGDERWSTARVAAFRCAIACFQNDQEHAETHATRALQGLPEDDHAYRAMIYDALGDTYRRNGRWHEARLCYLKVLDFPHVPGFRIRSVHVYGAMADLELLQGRLHASAAYWEKALSVIEERATWGSFPLPLIGWVYIRMGEILYEWNGLQEASDHLSRGLERAEMSGDIRAIIAGYLLASRLRLAEGDVESASTYLEQARPLVKSARFPEWISRFERLQIELWLAQDRLRPALAWAGSMLLDGGLERQPESKAASLSVARVLIVQGDTTALNRAITLVAHVAKVSEAEGRMGSMMEALALQALAHWRRGAQTAAMRSLEHVLRLAEPEGYVRLFADLGLPMARLLQEARSRDVLPVYVQTLLSACGAGLALAARQPLPESLTAREQEVLELMAAGLTNREIAATLVISFETVKKHATNIYSKLAVRNRREAVARARSLALLG